MAMRPEWTPGYAALVFATWAVMMAAMMLPGAAPAVFRAARPAPDRQEGARGIAAALAFTAGYLAVWTVFSAAATLAQWALDTSDLVTDALAIRNGVAAGLVIVAVGLYQLTPLKQSCLRHCASCLDGDRGRNARERAWRGMRYGVSCLGCCWALMALLFVAGAMNAFWMAAIALWVLAEKNLRWGGRIARLGGAGLVAWGSVALALAAF